MLRDISRVFFTNLIKMFVSLLMAFFIPALLSVEEYGTYKLYALYASYIGVFHFGFCDGIFLKYGGKSLKAINVEEAADEQTSLFCFEFVLTVIISTVGIFYRNVIMFFWGITFLPSIMISYYASMYQATGAFDKYARIFNITSLLNLLINSVLVFIVKEEKGYAFIVAQIVVNYLVFFYAVFSFNFHYEIRIRRFRVDVLFSEMRNGFLLMLGNMSYILFAGIDKWYIKLLNGMKDFSYYSFAAQLLSAINMFANPIALTFYSYMSRKKEKAFEYRMKNIMISLLFFMLSGVFVLKMLIERYIDKYTASLSVVSILFLSQVFLLLNTTIYVNLFKVYQMQKKYFVNQMMVIVVSVVLNAIFYIVGNGKMESIAMATVCAMIIWACLNLKSFPHLKLQRADGAFVVVCTTAYVLLSFSKINYLLQLVIYVGVWIATLRILMKNVYCEYISKMKYFLKKLTNLT